MDLETEVSSLKICEAEEMKHIAYMVVMLLEMSIMFLEIKGQHIAAADRTSNNHLLDHHITYICQ